MSYISINSIPKGYMNIERLRLLERGGSQEQRVRLVFAAGMQ